MAETGFDPWRTLGVPVGAGPDQIRRAFRGLARRMHPDVRHDQGAHEQFIRLRQAYETLMDEEMRSRLERQVMEADVEPLIILEDVEVTLGKAWGLLEGGYTDEARELYLEMSREHAGDPRLLELLDAIQRVEAGAVAADVGPRERAAEGAAGVPRWETYRDLWEPEPAQVRWWLAAVAGLVAATCVVAVRVSEAAPVWGGFSATEIALGALAGFLGAVLAAASGLLAGFDRALGAVVGGGAGRGAPLWLYLGVAGAVSPALALVFYVVFVLLETEWSWDVAGLFAGGFVLAGALAWAHGGQFAAVLVGPGVVFVPALIGWAIGSAFRPGYWWE